MSPYIVSYYRNIGFQNANSNQFYAILPIIVVISTLTFPIGMYLTNLFGSRRVVLLGTLFCCVAVFGSATIRHPLPFFFMYAGGFGVGKGFLYPAPLRASWSHLPGRTGFVSGAIVSGLGIGAFVYGLIVNRLVNPLNKEPIKTEIEPGIYEYIFEKEVSDNVPRMFFTLGIIWSIQLFLGILMISNFVKVEET